MNYKRSSFTGPDISLIEGDAGRRTLTNTSVQICAGKDGHSVASLPTQDNAALFPTKSSIFTHFPDSSQNSVYGTRNATDDCLYSSSKSFRQGHSTNHASVDSLHRISKDGLRTSLRDDRLRHAPRRPIARFDAGIWSFRDRVELATAWYILRNLSGNIIEDHLKVVAELGHGSLGVVQEVRTLYKPGFVGALQQINFVRKRVVLPRGRRAQLLDIVQSEAKVIESLVHVHIVHILGTYEHTPEPRPDRPSLSLLMFPVGERDLATLLHDTRHDNETVKGWIRQWFSCLTSALAYMHQEGVRHQDIKPSNIIHAGSHIYFTDFSSSAFFNPNSTTSTADPARTSRMYSPPEMLNAFMDDDSFYQRHGTGSDIFSLGCVFLEMLAFLAGASVYDVQDFIRQDNWSRGVIGHCYAHGIDSMLRFFSQLRYDEDNHEFLMNIILPMLIRDRKQQPSARNLLVIMKQLPYWDAPCKCSSPDIDVSMKGVPAPWGVQSWLDEKATYMQRLEILKSQYR